MPGQPGQPGQKTAAKRDSTLGPPLRGGPDVPVSGQCPGVFLGKLRVEYRGQSYTLVAADAESATWHTECPECSAGFAVTHPLTYPQAFGVRRCPDCRLEHRGPVMRRGKQP